MINRFLMASLAFTLHNGVNAITIQDLFTQGTQALQQGNIDRAVNSFKAIIDTNPQVTSAQYNLAYTYKIMGHPECAIPLYQNILEQQPDHDAAHLGLAFAYLSNGDYTHGWRAHEWNLKKQGKYAPELRALLADNALAGKTILLTPEGGLGDTIQFFRYGEKLKALGARVIAYVQNPLKQLLSHSPCFDVIISKDDPMPSHDARITYMSLPAALYDTEEEIKKNAVPYIFPDPALVEQWGPIIDAAARSESLSSQALSSEPLHAGPLHAQPFNVGLCWQADVFNDSSRLPIARRGIPLAAFDQLKKILHVQFYSIQKREGLDQLNTVAPDFPLHTFDDATFDEIHGPFMDTAAVIAHLDLVITIDSAIAHLAGAMGKPVFLLLPYVTDWRWLAGRTDSPWYPTMRIFRQPIPFDWAPVIDDVTQALADAAGMK